MDGMIHNCRFCGGPRPHNETYCLGCGTEIEKCKPVQTSRRKDPNCPKCTHNGPHQNLSATRRRCVKCTAVFEGADFGFVDDRPEVNLAKIERAESEKRKRAMKQ